MLIFSPTILMYIILISFPIDTLNSEKISEVLMPEKIKTMKERRSTREIHNEDLGKMFESAVHLLGDLKPDLLKLSSSLSRKRRVEKSNFYPPDHLPNCKDENSTRCHRTKHMKKKKHPHNAEKFKKYNLSKREEKRTVVAAKAKAAHPRANTSHRRRENSTDKGFDYEDMIFTPKTYDDTTATQPGVFDSIINLFARKQTTRNPMSTIEGFELPSEFQPTESTQRREKMMEHYRKHMQAAQTPQPFHFHKNHVQRPENRNQILQPENQNEILYAVHAPQVLESSRNQILQPENRNGILQFENRKQILRPENRNQIFQPENRNQNQQAFQTPQMFQFNRNQILQPENRNQVFQPENRNQVYQPIGNQILQASQTPQMLESNKNQIIQPEIRNQVIQPEIRNQVIQPEIRNQINQASQAPPMFEYNRNQILQPQIRNQIMQPSQTPQIFQPQQAIWNGNGITGNFQQPQQFQRVQRMESGYNFIPRNNDGYLKNPDMNYIDNPEFNDDYATSEQEVLNNNNVIETQMFPKNNINWFQNQTDVKDEDNRIVSRSSNSSPESQGHIKVKLQERAKNANDDSLNTAADVHVGNIGALNPANDIHSEILNASCEADIKKSRLEQYLNNYGRKRTVENSTVKEKNSSNPTETTQSKKKKNIQTKSFKQKAHITLKPTTNNLANALFRKGKKTKIANYYPGKRFSDRETLHQSGHPSDTYWEFNSDEDSLFNNPMSSDASNYEEPPLYYY